MGRYVYENGKSVWKYVFSEQASEQSRIVDELGIGKYSDDDEEQDIDGDYVILSKNDIPKLEKYLNEEISYDILGISGKATRLQVVEFYETLQAQFDMIRYDHIEDHMFTIIRKMFDEDIHFWCMIVAYINHMKEENDRDYYEFFGEY